MSLRRFSSEYLRLCDEWFNTIETNENWIDLGPVGEGESRSIRVQSELTKIVAVAKPGPEIASSVECRAAHEKIAFDLAHSLELLVPPVVLWSEGLGNTYVRGRNISAWAFPQSQQWNAATNLLTPELINSASDIFSAMRVFHTWISDSDRKSDHTQVDLNSQNGKLGVSFIDHAFSLSQQWKLPDAPNGACPVYMPTPENHVTLKWMITRIEALADTEIERLVNRIPVAYLPEAERGLILSNLITRRQNLNTILSL